MLLLNSGQGGMPILAPQALLGCPHHRLSFGAPTGCFELRRQNPDWGKARIAQELAKANNWVPLVSPNTVKRILKDAGLWPDSAAEKKGSWGNPGPDG